MGASTDAARAEVLARRELLLEEMTHLEASARAAVDIPAKVRRNPVQTAGLAGGAAFVLLGGPQRLFKRVRRTVRGRRADMPKSMLPEEVDRHLKRLGDDGDRVRAILEREFADYLERTQKERESRQLGSTLVAIGGNLFRPIASQAGRRMAQQLFTPDTASFAQAVGRIRERREAGRGRTPGVSTTADAGKPASGK